LRAYVGSMPMISPTQSNAQAALSSFLSQVLPGVAGAQPAVFSGTISGSLLTVSEMFTGAISSYAPLLGAAPGSIILSQASGSSGGIGTYNISVSQIASNSKTMATGVSIIAGQQNRAMEPVNPFFVVMTPIRFDRFATNVDYSDDVKFVGSIASNVLTVTHVDTGVLTPGATVFGANVVAGTTIIYQMTGAPIGGIGTYQVSKSQTILSETLSAGWKTLTQDAQITIQIDFHSSDTTAGDFAQTVSTALRDAYGVDFFASLAIPLNGVVPLYADDPVQRPFVNAENQFEWRWSLDCRLEVIQTIRVPEQYSDSATVTLVDVPAIFPA
jgi:hypothetical protein